MKKSCTLLFVLVLGLTGASHAQLKPVSGDIGLGFNLSGIDNISFDEWSSDVFNNPQVFGRFYLSDRLVLRTTIGVGLTSTENTRSATLEFTDLITNEEITVDTQIVSSVSQFSFSIAPGIEYHLTSQASKLDPYVGAVVPFGLSGPRTVETQSSINQQNVTLNQPLFAENITETNKSAGTTSIGFSLLAGFNYFFTDNFAIGAEYSIGFLSTSQGGTVENSRAGTRQTDPASNQVEVIDESSEFEAQNSNTSITSNASGGINISIFW
ncbi:MAG: hypothetical protein AAGI38_06795 [Bacteroidota bacterium]